MKASNMNNVKSENFLQPMEYSLDKTLTIL